MPQTCRFGPLDIDSSNQVQMSVDEYEAIRLMDFEGCNQEECAAQMGIARTTLQGIYNDARKKIAEALVQGKNLTISGGDYTLCEDFCRGNGCGCVNSCHKKTTNQLQGGEENE